MEPYAPIHPERPLARAAVALGIAIGVHVVGLLLLFTWAVAVAAAALKADAGRPKEVALTQLDRQQWERNRSVAKEYVPSAAFDDSAATARPERARFLSDRDRRAERETVAKAAPGMPGGPAPTPLRETPPPAATPPVPVPPPEPKAGMPGLPLDAVAEGLGPRPGLAPPALLPQPRSEPRPLVMNFDVKGDGGVPDINGVAVGNLTVLNAEAWRYATFFDRVGSTLYGVWRVDFLPRPPVPSIVARPKGGSVRVAFGITLDAGGRAVEVRVRRSSGLPDVDALLAELIQRSAPFPNVPQGLLDADARYSDVWILGLVWGWNAR